MSGCRRTMPARWRAAGLLAALAVAVAAPAHAVSCGPFKRGNAAVRVAFDSATHVFSAHVAGIDNGHAFGRDMRLARLRVLQVWKGPLAPGDTVPATAEDTVHLMDDGVVPVAGTTLLVYADADAPPLMLHTCSRTGVLDARAGDRRVLDTLSHPRRPQPAH